MERCRMKADNSKIYQATIYLRLSKEDGDVAASERSESNSILNQKDLIMDYVGKHSEIHVHSVRVDDGYYKSVSTDKWKNPKPGRDGRNPDAWRKKEGKKWEGLCLQ